MPTVVLGTAGHIDHGKTALLRALTGIDADRLPEEQVRGMTIDVGYAHLAFEDGVELDFVDVPGHDRLIGNMLVGAGEIDAALFVVAADDGPRPQTIEHLQLLDALGIDDGLAVITKTDLVDEERVSEVRRVVQALLAGTSLAGSPVLAASAATGVGIEAVRERLRVLRDSVADEPEGDGAWIGSVGPVRLAVDRTFSVRGRGAVVTGSLRGGRPIERGTTLRREPGGGTMRVREVQVHGRPRDANDGGRTALGLAGLNVGALRRGDVLTLGPGITATDRLLVSLRPPALDGRAAWPPKDGTHLRLHVGTDQVDSILRRIRGAPTVATLSLAEPVATFVGDRGVLRRPSPSEVVGGIRVLDSDPPRGTSRRRMTPERLDGLATALTGRDADAVEAARIELHGTLPIVTPARPDAAARLALAPDVGAALEAAALETVIAHHRTAPLSAGLTLPRARAALLRKLRSLVTIERRDADAARNTVADLLDGLVASGRLAREGDLLRDPARAAGLPDALVAAMSRLETALSVAAPPGLAAAAALAGSPPEGIRALQASGRIVRIAPDLAWSAATYHHLAAVALEQARIRPLTPAAFRDATDTSRKYVVAILEDLDRRGILRRTPEGHIPGPKAPRRESPT